MIGGDMAFVTSGVFKKSMVCQQTGSFFVYLPNAWAFFLISSCVKGAKPATILKSIEALCVVVYLDSSSSLLLTNKLSNVWRLSFWMAQEGMPPC